MPLKKNRLTLAASVLLVFSGCSGILNSQIEEMANVEGKEIESA